MPVTGSDKTMLAAPPDNTRDTVALSGLSAQHRQRRPLGLRGRALHHLLVGVFLIIILALSYTQWPRTLDHLAYDLATRMVPGEADLSSVAFVEMGIAESTPDHDTLSRALAALQSQGVQAIGVYLPLNLPQSPPDLQRLMHAAEQGERGAPDPRWLTQLDLDGRLATTLRRHGNVVLAAPPAAQSAATNGSTLSPVAEGFVAWHAHPWLAPLMYAPGANISTLPLAEPIAPLASAARAVGAALPMTPGRGVPLAVRHGDAYRAGFLLPLLALAQGGTAELELELQPGRGIRLGTELIPLGPGLAAHPLPPRRDLRRGGVETISLDMVLGRGASVTDRLTGRTVILGPGAPRSHTGQPADTVPEALWQTYVLGSLLDGAWVRVPAWTHGLERLLLLLVCLYLLVMPARLMGRASGLLVGLLLGVVIFNAGLLLLLVQQLWLPVTLPVVALLLGHSLIWGGLHYADANERDRLDASRAHRQLGAMLRAQGDLEAAFEHLVQARVVDDGLREELYQLGHDLVRRRQYARAREVYGHLEWLSPSYRDVPVRIERLKGLAGQGRARLGTEHSTADSNLIVDGDTLEKPTLGRYQIECQLGRGSMGVVYLGVDPKIGRKVAIKTLALNQEFASEMLAQVKWRFFREAEASGRLNHRNIVTIYDVGEEHDLAFIAMDYLEGSSLESYVHRDALLPVAEVLEICAQVADGLAYAHDQHVIHRDVKPANVIYDRSRHSVKITDFGIACLTDNNRTRTGTILGTPAFMSPEQVSGQPVDGRSDLFALGVTLYQLLTGQLPFTADTMAGLVYQITQTRHQSLSELRPELGPLVALIVNRALEKDPARRYQSGTELAKGLRDCAVAIKRGPKPGQFTGHQATNL
ncbi:MAG: protein kinase [Thioalkalivibrio sp.]